MDHGNAGDAVTQGGAAARPSGTIWPSHLKVRVVPSPSLLALPSRPFVNPQLCYVPFVYLFLSLESKWSSLAE